MKKTLLFLMVTFLTIVSAFSQTLDQSNAPNGFGDDGYFISSTSSIGQSFIAGITGNLSQVNIRFIYNEEIFIAGDFQLRILSGNGYGGTVLNTTTFSVLTAPTNLQELAISLSSSVPVISGSTYTIDLIGIDGRIIPNHTTANYANGGFYRNAGSTNYNNYDLWFKTFVTLPVSTPATHLNFDGSNDYVNCGTSSNFDFTTGTVEAWINVNASSISKAVISKRNSTTQTRWSLHVNEDGNYFGMFNGTVFTTLNVGTINPNTWYHVSFVFNANNTITVYMDGVNKGIINSGMNSITGTSFIIGASDPVNQIPVEHFSGSIDDVRVWNTIRTETQINNSKDCELQGNESGLIAYYNFNQGNSAADNTSIATLTDATLNANNGTFTNMALTGNTSNFLSGSHLITINSATVSTPVVYTQGDTAVALTATAGVNGTGLLWYTAATGGTGTAAPTPSTVNPGNTSYWVSSTNANGCESARTEIVVTVNAVMPGCWVSVTTGNSNALAIKTDGTLWSWGANDFSELGLGDTTPRNAPAQVGNLTNWQSVSTGGVHTLAVKTDGTLWSWGYNSSGELGLGDTTPRNTPTQVGNLTNWQSVSTGGGYTTAIKTDGTLWSWGANGSGELGLGDTTPRNTPTQVGNLTNWQRVSCGSSHTLAIKTDGTLWSWGNNYYGQLGLGDTTPRNTPTQVGNLTNWQSVFTGSSHTLAIKTDGTIWSWGNNNGGQLGLGDLTPRNTPTQVGNLTNWQKVSSGAYQTLAINTDGTLWSWGAGANGQLGLGSTSFTDTPMQLGVDTNWQSVSCGRFYTVAIKSASIYSCGYNAQGQLGLGDNTDRNTPTEVACPTVLDTDDFVSQTKVTIYPNPSNGIFNIVSQEDITIEVYDMIGKKVITKNATIGASNLDLSNYASGIYLLTVTNQKGSLNTYRLVKQ